MKTILLSLLLSLALPSSQVDPVKHMNYVTITPVRWVHNQPNVERMYAYISSDNLTNQAVVNYQLCVTPPADTWAYIVASGSYTITGEDYDSYINSGIDYLFTYLADSTRLNLEIQ